jgi:hypothetical protein
MDPRVDIAHLVSYAVVSTKGTMAHPAQLFSVATTASRGGAEQPSWDSFFTSSQASLPLSVLLSPMVHAINSTLCYIAR